MRKLIVSNLISIDGFIAGPGGDIDWMDVDKDFESYIAGDLESIGVMLFGRVTYELMVGYWPGATPTENDPRLIEAMNNLPKIVFSNTLPNAEWNNTTLLRGDAVKETLKLKQEDGKDIVVFGSGKIVSALAEAGLVDEYRIFVSPVILGSGESQFRGRLKLRLLGTRTFGKGLVLLNYAGA